MEYDKTYSLIYMNIQQLKVAMSTKSGAVLTSLSLVQQFEDAEKTKPTPWVSHWDDNARVRVTFHTDVAEKIKADPNMTGLAFKTKTVEEHKLPTGEVIKAYQHLVVITPQNIAYSF